MKINFQSIIQYFDYETYRSSAKEIISALKILKKGIKIDYYVTTT